MGRIADHPAAAWLLAAVALGIAAVGARPYAGSWNDGSRLAAVESLIDRGTLAIDDSIFCKPPPHLHAAGTPPYPADDAGLLALGTLDKLYVHGHYHSDKPALVSVLMAAAYQPLLWAGVPPPAVRPDLFCRVMTLLTSGLGYAAAVGCMWVLGRRVGLAPGWRLVWLAAFALCTYAPAYTRHVNNHAMELGLLAAACVLLLRIAQDGSRGWASVAGLGTLAGLGFNLDFGSGPPLVALLGAAVVWQTRRFGPVAVFALAALPWVAAGEYLNYAIGGGWKPPNMYPQYFDWPGSPFDRDNMTGFFRHHVADQLLYLGGMLFGKHGFWNHNLPLLLAVAAGWRVFRAAPHRDSGRAVLLATLGWCVATWLLYGILSNNMGGGCCSVRWFVPCLAPGFWLLALLLRDRPEYRPDFLALAGWGAALGAIMWWTGPWTQRMVPMMWPVVGAALLTWGTIAYRRWRSTRTGVVQTTDATVRVERRAA